MHIIFYQKLTTRKIDYVLCIYLRRTSAKKQQHNGWSEYTIKSIIVLFSQKTQKKNVDYKKRENEINWIKQKLFRMIASKKHPKIYNKKKIGVVALI